MFLSRSGLMLLSLCTVLLAGTVTIPAQKADRARSDKSFEVYLHFVTGSPTSYEKGGLPNGLRKAFNGLSQDYGFKDFRVVSTQFQRIGNGGQLASKAILDRLGGFAVENWSIVTEWNLGSIDHFSDDPGRISVGQFQFSARLPTRTNEKISYETVHYRLRQVDVREGRPTVIGSLSIPQSREMLFFVLHVGTAD